MGVCRGCGKLCCTCERDRRTIRDITPEVHADRMKATSYDSFNIMRVIKNSQKNRLTVLTINGDYDRIKGYLEECSRYGDIKELVFAKQVAYIL